MKLKPALVMKLKIIYSVVWYTFIGCFSVWLI